MRPVAAPARAPVKIGPYVMPSRYFLAPLAGYTNVALRRTVRELGGLGLATTDLVNARSLLEGSRKALELIATHPDDVPLAVQIYGSEAQYLVRAARRLIDGGTRIIDINMGCPVHKITRLGGGSALMCDTTGSTVELVRQVVEAAYPVPVTVKMRLGWDANSHTAPEFARAFEEVGVAAVTIHGRTREQGFSGTVDLAGIRRVVEAVERIPVVGNGDVRTPDDARTMFAVTGCAAIAIGRGALYNPWIFRQLDNLERTGDPGDPPAYQERLTFMENHLDRLIDLRGEKFGCIQFRKVANYYCKVLKPGKAVQQILVMLDTRATFAGVVERLREIGPPPGWKPGDVPTIAVPKGPNERW